MARHYNKWENPRHLDAGELVLRRVALTTRDSTHGKLVQTGKDLTRLLTASGEVLTTKGHLMGKSDLTLGTLSTKGSTTCAHSLLLLAYLRLNLFSYELILWIEAFSPLVMHWVEKSERPISSTLLQCLRGSEWSTQVAKVNMEGGQQTRNICTTHQLKISPPKVALTSQIESHLWVDAWPKLPMGGQSLY